MLSRLGSEALLSEAASSNLEKSGAFTVDALDTGLCEGSRSFCPVSAAPWESFKSPYPFDLRCAASAEGDDGATSDMELSWSGESCTVCASSRRAAGVL